MKSCVMIDVLCGVAKSRPSILVMVKSRVHLRYIFIIILQTSSDIQITQILLDKCKKEDDSTH